jgi:hypothetical protein
LSIHIGTGHHSGDKTAQDSGRNIANQMDSAAGGTAVLDGRISPIVSQSPGVAANGIKERQASTSSGKGMVIHEEGANGKPELKPIGIINEQNTCFLNSTFQAVSRAYQSCALG